MIKHQPTNTSKEKIRNYKPHTNQIYKDNLKDCYILVTNPYVLTEGGKCIIEYQRIGGGTVFIVTLDIFNSVLNDDFRFTLENDVEKVTKQESQLDSALSLLTEVLDEGMEDHLLYEKIKNFLEK